METGSSNPFADLRRHVENMQRRVPAAHARVLHEVAVAHARALNRAGEIAGRDPIFRGDHGQIWADPAKAAQYEEDEWGDETNAPQPIYRNANPQIKHTLSEWGLTEFHNEVVGR